MGKHGSTSAVGLVTKAARDPSQPTQEELDHTEKMNRWFVESFDNMFRQKFASMADAIGDADAKIANQVLALIYADIVTIKGDVHVVKLLLADSDDVKPEEVAAKFVELKKAIIASINFNPPVFGEPDERERAELATIKPTAFKFTVHPETPEVLETRTVEGAPARNRVGWRNLLKRWFS